MYILQNFHWRYLQCKLWGAISVRDKVSLSWWHKSKATRLLQSSAQLPAFTLLRTQSEDFHKNQQNGTSALEVYIMSLFDIIFCWPNQTIDIGVTWDRMGWDSLSKFWKGRGTGQLLLCCQNPGREEGRGTGLSLSFFL